MIKFLVYTIAFVMSAIFVASLSIFAIIPIALMLMYLDRVKAWADEP